MRRGLTELFLGPGVGVEYIMELERNGSDVLDVRLLHDEVGRVVAETPRDDCEAASTEGSDMPSAIYSQ